MQEAVIGNIDKEQAFIPLINQVARDITIWADGKGFWNIPSQLKDMCDDIPRVREFVNGLRKSQKLMLIVSELSELLEHLRKPGESSIAPITNETEELADAVIRILDYCGRYQLPIGEAICAKMAVNEKRPYQHGGKAF